MNERIQELEAQCWEHDQSWTGVGHRVFNSKKFAELIVRECAQFVEDRFDFIGDEIIVKEKMLEHFGVE